MQLTELDRSTSFMFPVILEQWAELVGPCLSQLRCSIRENLGMRPWLGMVKKGTAASN